MSHEAEKFSQRFEKSISVVSRDDFFASIPTKPDEVSPELIRLIALGLARYELDSSVAHFPKGATNFSLPWLGDTPLNWKNVEDFLWMYCGLISMSRGNISPNVRQGEESYPFYIAIITAIWIFSHLNPLDDFEDSYLNIFCEIEAGLEVSGELVQNLTPDFLLDSDSEFIPVIQALVIEKLNMMAKGVADLLEEA